MNGSFVWNKEKTVITFSGELRCSGCIAANKACVVDLVPFSKLVTYTIALSIGGKMWVFCFFHQKKINFFFQY